MTDRQVLTNELVKRLRGLRVDGTPVDVTMGQAADEIERLRALVGRMLPYVQRWESADAAELEAQASIEDEAERVLYATHEPRSSASTYVGYPDGSCQMCGNTLGEHVCPAQGTSRDASSTRVTVGCSQCTATVSLPQRDGLVDIDALGLWYFSTPTGWRCPAHAPAQRT